MAGTEWIVIAVINEFNTDRDCISWAFGEDAYPIRRPLWIQECVDESDMMECAIDRFGSLEECWISYLKCLGYSKIPDPRNLYIGDRGIACFRENLVLVAVIDDGYHWVIRTRRGTRNIPDSWIKSVWRKW